MQTNKQKKLNIYNKTKMQNKRQKQQYKVGLKGKSIGFISKLKVAFL
jgi:hypothetical protein